MSLLVRPATPADAPAVAGIHVAGWQVGYRGLLPDAHLDALSVPDRTASWTQALHADAQVLVAEDAGRVLGFSTRGPARDEDLPPATGEVQALYVAPEYWGRGVGGTLLDATLERLTAAGCAHSVLWALRTASRTRSFHTGRGWTPDGAGRVEQRPGLVLDVVRFRSPTAPRRPPEERAPEEGPPGRGRVSRHLRYSSPETTPTWPPREDLTDEDRRGDDPRGDDPQGDDPHP